MVRIRASGKNLAVVRGREPLCCALHYERPKPGFRSSRITARLKTTAQDLSNLHHYLHNMERLRHDGRYVRIPLALRSIATGTSAHEHVESSFPTRRYRRRMSFRAAFGRAGDDRRERGPCRNATTGFRGVDSVSPKELREPAGCHRPPRLYRLGATHDRMRPGRG